MIYYKRMQLGGHSGELGAEHEDDILEGRVLRRREKVRIKNQICMRRSKMIAVVLSLMFVVSIGCSCADGRKNNTDDSGKASAVNAQAEPKIVFEIPSAKAYADEIADNVSRSADESKTDESSAIEEPEPEPDDLSTLKRQIDGALESYSGNWSVYVKNLNTGVSFSINDRQMYAASEIKLFAMTAAYQQISEGYLNEADIYGSLREMITESSNEDFNRIVWNVGKYYITDWCSENGYEDTVQCHGLYPAYNADGLETTWSGYNCTTVEDLGRLLESIYNGECVSKECSDKMLELLCDQHIVNKIPAGVPENVTVANKTGETLDFCHDAAIIYSENADYILTVMVDAPGYAWSCSDNVTELSELVYEYFNSEGIECRF